MRPKHVHTWLAVLVALVFASAARPSHADTPDYKGHPGSACRPVHGERAAQFAALGAIHHRGSAPDSVVCPIVRDSLAAPAAPLDVGIAVQSSGGSRLSCTFYSLGSTGDLIAASSRSTYSATPTTLYFTVRPDHVGFAGSYYIRCALPPGGSIFNYYCGEAADTDDHR